LMHVGARYYEVETGRFVQRDPILGFIFSPLSLNSYVYCMNNPVEFIDPLGTTPEKVLLLIVGIVVIVIIIGGIISNKPSSPALPSCPRGYPMNPEEGRGTGCPDPHCPNEMPGCCSPAEKGQDNQDQQPQRTSLKNQPFIVLI